MFLQALPGAHRYIAGMTHKLTPGTAALLVTAPLLWAGNAVVGRLVHDLVPPITLNFLRWTLAFVLLLPLAYSVLRRDHPVWAHWRRYALLGLLGIGLYNPLQYMASQTSTPINVTPAGSSMPVWMLAVGAGFFGVTVTRRQLAGAALSMAGVPPVLRRGEWSEPLALRWVPGDPFMLLATISWSFYSRLKIGAHQPARQSAYQLGGFLNGAAGVWPGLVGRFCQRGVGRRTHADHLGLAAGGSTGLYRPSGRPWWPTAAGAWAYSAPGPQWPVSSPTSRHCLPD